MSSRRRTTWRLKDGSPTTSLRASSRVTAIGRLRDSSSMSFTITASAMRSPALTACTARVSSNALARARAGGASARLPSVIPRSRVVVRAAATTSELVDRARSLTNDLMDMKTAMPTVRRAVAGARNDLNALQLYQDALEGKVPDDYDQQAKLERVLDALAQYVIEKAEEEQFWYDTENKVQSSVVDNTNLTDEEKREVSGMVANVAMWGVQGAVWNALILLVGFVSLVTFVLPNQ